MGSSQVYVIYILFRNRRHLSVYIVQIAYTYIMFQIYLDISALERNCLAPLI